MKKYLLLLLISSFAIAQVNPQKITKLAITANVTSTTATKVNVQEADGVINTISKADLIDVLEFASAINLPVTGVAGKIYVTIDNSKMYRWNGTVYSEYFLGKEDKANKGVANGYASLDAAGKVPLIQINDALLGSVNYKGTYNATTNIPALPTPVSGNKGFYFIVSTAGVQLGLTLNAGDWVISNGEGWGKVDNNNAVTSVNGLVGSVVLTKSSIGIGNIDNTSDLNKPISIAEQTALNLKQNTITGTANVIPKFGSGGLVGSNIFENGTNVGFGTTTPTQKLDVSAAMGNGTIPFLASTVSDITRGFRVTSGIISTAGFDVGGLWATTQVPTTLNAAILADNSGNTYINAPTSAGIYFSINNAYRQVISSSGNVLINSTTDNGVDKLQVNGTISASSATLSNQVVVKSQLDAITNNTNLTGTPTAPTAIAGTNNLQVANTAFVAAATKWNQIGNDIQNNNTGSVSIGGDTFDGAKLKIKSLGSTSATYALSIVNSLGNNLLSLRDSGQLDLRSDLISTFGGTFANVGASQLNGGFFGSGANALVNRASWFESSTQIRYAVDLSASYTDRSLVDKGYVDKNKLISYTVATLPAGTQGDTAYVTNALSPTYLSIIAGGGTVVTPVFFNGTNWVAH